MTRVRIAAVVGMVIGLVVLAWVLRRPTAPTEGAPASDSKAQGSGPSDAAPDRSIASSHGAPRQTAGNPVPDSDNNPARTALLGSVIAPVHAKRDTQVRLADAGRAE